MEKTENKLPHITELGDGIYFGKMSAHVLTYNGRQYMCTDGVRGMNCSVRIEVKDGVDNILIG